jgi:hypothetical protein
MLKEFTNIRQGEPGIFRRWYSDDYFELIVWFAKPGDGIVGFQLCYRSGGEMNALTYSGGAYSHDAVDEGGKWNETPILTRGGVFPKEAVLDEFKARSAGIEPSVRDYVAGKIAAYSAEPEFRS